MKNTENELELPPIDTFHFDEFGLRKWRPVFDTICVDVTAKGVRMQVRQGDISLVFDLSSEEAVHVIKLLSEARCLFLNRMKPTPEVQPNDHKG